MREKIIFSWGSGKDSVLSLYELRKTGKYETVALLTTISKEFNRVSFHGVPAILVEKQADSIGIPIDKIILTASSSVEEYASKLEETLLKYKKRRIKKIVYGDIFLEDLREFRIKCLDKMGMEGIFPLWKRNTKELIETFINLGFKAITTSVDSKVLDKSFVGRMIDKNFLNDLPENVDPCGENGEFHTFVFDGPIFREKINFSIGKIVLRDSFYYCDLIGG
ncbi:MAG: diphthine--ammonia ligase [Candidatus Aenigmarchaeota archaeon]|nr:diphthine--ammonia ligase [Candidatus Aenigmarchaeota archaeon]